MINTSTFHTSVLLQESVDALTVSPSKWYVDCTLGGGGHTAEILKRGGNVLGIDQDTEALKNAQNYIESLGLPGVFIAKHSNFKHIESLVNEENIKPVGILFDLGVSSYQLGGNLRGFSFQANEPLDMRMDPENQGATAKDLVNGLYEKELEKLISTYGEDQLARSLARAIVRARSIKPIETTSELAEITREVYQRVYHSHSRLNPATKTFQALRIAVNDEMNVLEEGLEASLRVLESQGRIVVITFHGLEDKIVKDSFRKWETEGLGTIMTNKPLTPSEKEIEANPRSRSAKLRVFYKA